MCYSFHPEIQGASEKEYNAGNNVCKEEKCKRKGEALEPAFFCDICQKMIPFEEEHKH